MFQFRGYAKFKSASVNVEHAAFLDTMVASPDQRAECATVFLVVYSFVSTTSVPSPALDM